MDTVTIQSVLPERDPVVQRQPKERRTKTEPGHVKGQLGDQCGHRGHCHSSRSLFRTTTPLPSHVPVDLVKRAVDATRTQRRRDRREEGDSVHRRQFLGAIAGIAAPVVGLGSPREGSQLGSSDIDALRRHTARLRRLDDVLGGADTYHLYAAEVSRTGLLLSNARYTEAIGQQLRSLLGEQHQLAGWAAFDSGHHAQARQHYLDSYTAGRDAEDLALAGNALAFVAYQETATNKDGTGTAQASHDVVRAMVTPRVEALLLERKAFAHAVVGNARQADTALAQARAALRRTADRPEPDWVFWVDEHEIDIMAGRCWTELRRPLRAVPVLENVLATFDDTHGRDKALYLTWLASSYLQAREVEQAATTLVRAHELSNGVASVRPAARISRVAGRLARYRDLPEVSGALRRVRGAVEPGEVGG